MKVAYSDNENVRKSSDTAFEFLSDDLKVVVHFLQYIIKSNGFGLCVEKWEDNILDQCKWTTDLANILVSEITKPKEDPKNKPKKSGKK